jgi:aldehyde dehydrogenase (NAD+)
LYLLKYSGTVEDAIAVKTERGIVFCNHMTNLREAELFLSVTGSDCGIANVNIGTSGAEIGGALEEKRYGWRT